MLKRLITALLMVMLLASAFGHTHLTQAQGPGPTTNGIAVCVFPTEGTPYTLIFRETTGFGMIIPVDAQAVVMSNVPVVAGIWRVAPDAASGGYVALERLAQSTAQFLRNTPTLNPCPAANPELLERNAKPWWPPSLFRSRPITS
jgi:hypothetical protein